jgi:transcription elongation factor Elf1
MLHRKISKYFNKVVARGDELQRFIIKNFKRKRNATWCWLCSTLQIAIQGVINEIWEEIISYTMDSKETEREEMKEETHDIEDSEQDELDEEDNDEENEE